MFNVDLTGVEETNFDLVPVGEYEMVCELAEVKTNKAGTGEYIQLRFRITAGEFKDRRVFEMLNIKNENPKAVQIGLSKLKTMLKCMGLDTNCLTDVNTLLGRKLMGKIKIQKDDTGRFSDKNVISFFKPLSATTGQATEDRIPF